MNTTTTWSGALRRAQHDSFSRENMGRHGQVNYVQLAGQLLRCKRVAIVGNEGAGKTTLAKILQGLLAIDYVEILWDSEKITPSEVQEIRERMVHRENWIIDGDFGLLDLADKVIFLDFTRFVYLRRYISRSINNFLAWRLDVPRVLLLVPGKTLDLLRFLVVALRHPFRDRAAIILQLASQTTKDGVIRFTSPRQVTALIEALNAQAGPANNKAGARAG